MNDNSKLYALNTNEEETRTLEEIFIDFFQQRTIEDARDMLGNFFYVAITSDCAEFDDGMKRDGAVLFCREIDALLTAIDKQLLQKKQQKLQVQS